jgi:signal transduction histidine kinase
LADSLMVKADPARLKQVLLNVVYNAAKFTDHGGITIRARIEDAHRFEDLRLHQNGNSSKNGKSAPLLSANWVVVSVEDTGIGIDPSQQQKLFRPFVMVDGTTTRKFEGTGLGLAISRNLVELMGGTIALFSEGLDQGTTVEIALPLVETHQDPKTIGDRSDSLPNPRNAEPMIS